MPTHTDHHIPYEEEARKTVEQKSQGPVIFIVALAIFVLAIYFLFLR